MAFTREELSAKFTSGELKINHGGDRLIGIKKATHEQLIKFLQKGTMCSGITFLRLVSALLMTNSQREVTTILDYTGVLIRNNDPYFCNLRGCWINVVNLNDDGTYWGITETGPKRKSAVEWMAHSSVTLETSMVQNYSSQFRSHDPRFWHIADYVNDKPVRRPDKAHQVYPGSVEEYYRFIEQQVHRLKSLFTDTALPPMTILFSNPVIWHGLKRPGEFLEKEGAAKRARND